MKGGVNCLRGKRLAGISENDAAGGEAGNEFDPLAASGMPPLGVRDLKR